ncbi:hypothetical protein APHNYW_1606 [Anaplasma phagocytophilum str. ApNYW]|nr:hypothetical protein APHNYW_1606 [Anaplasma phagocytophilum str. ApNYW]
MCYWQTDNLAAALAKTSVKILFSLLRRLGFLIPVLIRRFVVESCERRSG